MMKQYLAIGIDVSTKTNVVACLDAEGKIVDTVCSFPQNQLAANDLVNWLIKLAKKQESSELLIGTEATSFYDLPILDYLQFSEELKPFNPTCYRFNAKYIKKFRDSLGEKEKTDWQDAQVIAEKLRIGRLPHPYLAGQPHLSLQRLTRYRVHLVETIAREKQYLLAHLFLKYPNYRSSTKLGQQVFGKTSQAILEDFFSPEELAKNSINDLTAFIVKTSHNRTNDPEELAKRLQKMSRESYRLRPSLAKSVNVVIALSLRSIRALTQTLAEINQAIADEIKVFPNTLESMPGIGHVYAAGLLAEIGQVERFSSSDQLAKFAGLWWPRYQSGDFEAEDRHLSKAGNRYLRYYLVEAANSCRRHNLEYQAYYQKKYREVSKHQHKRALILTARKLVRLVYALLKRGELYQGSKF